jgi:hypothetical protein
MAGLPTGMVMEKRLFQWCPIYVEPIPGSGERIVLAIAACDGKHDAVVEPIAPIERLPDGWLRASLHAIGPLLGAFEATLIEHGSSTLVSEAVLSHGVCLGVVRRAYGTDARQVAHSVSKTTAVLSVFTQDIPSKDAKNDEAVHLSEQLREWAATLICDFESSLSAFARNMPKSDGTFETNQFAVKSLEHAISNYIGFKRLLLNNKILTVDISNKTIKTVEKNKA